MKQWVDVTNTFSERQRHYKTTYLEICEVFDEMVEVSLFSSENASFEIYFSFGIMYGIIYVEKENAYERREQMKFDLEQEYRKNGKPTNEFISSFTEKYKVCMSSDVVFDEDAFMRAMMSWDE